MDVLIQQTFFQDIVVTDCTIMNKTDTVFLYTQAEWKDTTSSYFTRKQTSNEYLMSNRQEVDITTYIITVGVCIDVRFAPMGCPDERKEMIPQICERPKIESKKHLRNSSLNNSWHPHATVMFFFQYCGQPLAFPMYYQRV